jgi:hypothetical protein
MERSFKCVNIFLIAPVFEMEDLVCFLLDKKKIFVYLKITPQEQFSVAS